MKLSGELWHPQTVENLPPGIFGGGGSRAGFNVWSALCKCAPETRYIHRISQA
jgi:hypothetical protein